MAKIFSTLSVVFFLVATVAFALPLRAGVKVTTADANWARLNGLDFITVTGTGFRTYSSATCDWDGRWQSSIAIIQDDNTIRCASPVIDKATVTSLPVVTTFSVYFDGDIGTATVVSTSFVFGPTLRSIAPVRGYVKGGELFVANGQGWGDFTSAAVYFDGVLCTDFIDPIGQRADYLVGDGIIQCKVPAGSFNRDAVVTIVFDNNPIYTLYSAQTYHYGPVLTSVAPACGALLGGTKVTIFGEGLDDDTIADSALPLSGPTVELLIPTSLGTTRYYGINPVVNQADRLITFITPNLGNSLTFGIQGNIQVFWKQVQSRVGVVGSFTYGARVDPTSLSPKNLRVGGGEKLSFSGCGLENFNTTFLTVNLGTTAICNRGAGAGSANDTLQIVPNPDGSSTISCTTVGIGCTSPGAPYSVTLSISNLPSPIAGGTVITLPAPNSMNITVGPIISSIIGPLRGPRIGGTVVGVLGSGFTANGVPLSLTVTLRPVSSLTTTFATVTGFVLSDTQLDFTTPPGLFGLDVQASFLFGSGDAACTGGNSVAPLVFHYGPTCSSFTPSFGRVVGGDRVTLVGAGFLEDSNVADDIDVQFCIRRLGGSQYNCTSAEAHSRSDFIVDDDIITVTTPSWRQNVLTRVGGNRLFGDKADVYVYFRAPGSSIGSYGRDFNEALLAPGITKAVIRCGSIPFTFGPQISALTPNKAQNGNFPTTTVVTASGPAVDDSFFGAGTPLVTIGAQIQTNSTVVAGSTTAKAVRTTVLGNLPGAANTIPNVVVTFNTCNQTTSAFQFKWGPVINSVSVGQGSTLGSVIYGCNPNGGQAIVIIGQGFSAFFNATLGLYARCVIGNTISPANYISDTQIGCVTPSLSWGTRAPLSVQFGVIPANPTTPIDWRNTVSTGFTLAYTINSVSSLSPTTGPVSGGTTVTLTPAGLGGFTSFKVVFGSYGVNAFAFLGTLSVTTPVNRADFNSDVPVYVVLDGVSSWIARMDSTFHYGPQCGASNTLFCSTAGCSATISGAGFQDCNIGDADTRNCNFRFYNIEYVDSQGGVVSVASGDALAQSPTSITFNAPARPANFRAQIQIRFTDVPIQVNNTNQNVIVCTTTIQYGPSPASLVSSTSLLPFTNNIQYGWTGDAVFISGVQLNDITPLQCVFTNSSGGVSTTPVVSFSSAYISCSIGDAFFGSTAKVSIIYTGGIVVPVPVGTIRYGPVFFSSTPNLGPVAGGSLITVTGAGFTCCGITTVEALFTSGATAVTVVSDTQLTLSSPANVNIDRVITFGFRYTSPLFPLTLNNQFSQLYAANGVDVLSFSYGPVLDSIAPLTGTKLSGRNQIITLTGRGFNDPYFTDAFCDYILADGSNQLIGSVKLLPTEKSATQLLCRVPEFAFNCGTTVFVSPRWRRFNLEAQPNRPEQGRFYWQTVSTLVRNSLPVPATVDGSNTTRFFGSAVSFGFSIQAAALLPSGGPLVVPAVGGTVIQVTTSNLNDYYSNSTTRDFGPGTVVCVWGSYRSPVSTFVANQDGVTPTVFNCTVPAAPIGTTQPLSILVNPNENADTTVVGGFEWLPLVSRLSRSFGSTQGGDEVTVQGSGFSKYSTVTCLFGGVQAIRSDITDDTLVTCVTPASAPGQVQVVLNFCNSAGVCVQLSSKDQVVVPTPFTYVGLTSSFPASGSVCGNQVVRLNGFGFLYFETIQCSIASQLVPARIISDTAIDCVAADIHTAINPLYQGAECERLGFVGTRAGKKFVFTSELTFQYGFPQITSITPESADIDELPTLLTLRGIYFNTGIQPTDTVDCRFGNIKTDAVLVPNDDDDDTYRVLCYTPPASSLTVGSYPVEVRFSCFNTTFTSDRLTFEVTQNSVISSFTPTSSFELGGVDVVITGDSFNGGTNYLCSFGDINAGTNTIVNGRFNNGTLSISPQIQIPLAQAALISPDVDSKRSVSPRAILGTGDTITCRAPYRKIIESQHVDLAISIDGGQHWVYARDRFLYENILGIRDTYCARQVIEHNVFDSDNSATSLATSTTTLFMLVVSMIVFLLA